MLIMKKLNWYCDTEKEKKKYKKLIISYFGKKERPTYAQLLEKKIQSNNCIARGFNLTKLLEEIYGKKLKFSSKEEIKEYFKNQIIKIFGDKKKPKTKEIYKNKNLTYSLFNQNKINASKLLDEIYGKDEKTRVLTKDISHFSDKEKVEYYKKLTKEIFGDERPKNSDLLKKRYSRFLRTQGFTAGSFLDEIYGISRKEKNYQDLEKKIKEIFGYKRPKNCAVSKTLNISYGKTKILLENIYGDSKNNIFKNKLDGKKFEEALKIIKEEIDKNFQMKPKIQVFSATYIFRQVKNHFPEITAKKLINKLYY